MANLTKEYFDQQLKKLATREEIKKLATKEELKKLATKEDLVKLEGTLKAHTEHEVAELAGMVARRFNDLERKLDIKADVDQPKTQMKKAWNALNLS